MYNYKKYVICVAVALVMGAGAAMAYAENNKCEQSHEIIADSSSNIESSSSLNESSLNDSSECSSNSSETSDSNSTECMQNNTEVEHTEVIYAETNSNQSDFEVTTPEIGNETECEISVAVADVAPVTDEQPEPELCEAVTENEYLVVTADYTPYDLYNQGRLYWGGYQYTWYSEGVLPGYGLEIEGRYTDADGFVCDGEGYICVAASSLDKGTVVDTPFGREGKVYDCGCDYGVIDVYVNW